MLQEILGSLGVFQISSNLISKTAGLRPKHAPVYVIQFYVAIVGYVVKQIIKASCCSVCPIA